MPQDNVKVSLGLLEITLEAGAILDALFPMCMDIPSSKLRSVVTRCLRKLERLVQEGSQENPPEMNYRETLEMAMVLYRFGNKDQQSLAVRVFVDTMHCAIHGTQYLVSAALKKGVSNSPEIKSVIATGGTEYIYTEYLAMVPSEEGESNLREITSFIATFQCPQDPMEASPEERCQSLKEMLARADIQKIPEVLRKIRNLRAFKIVNPFVFGSLECFEVCLSLLKERHITI